MPNLLAPLERQMDLLLVLMAARLPVTRAQLRAGIPGYGQDSEDAFERMFERDKTALRDRGIAIEVRPLDVAHDDETGYLISRKTQLLPDIPLTATERTLLRQAAAVLRTRALGVAAHEAAARIGTGSGSSLPGVQLGADESNIDVVFDAIHSQGTVSFEYEGRAGAARAVRVVEPWRLLRTAGAWYLIGMDVERGAERVFRLDRVAGPIASTGQPATHLRPTTIDVRAIVDGWRALPGERVTATLLVDPGTAPHLRASAVSITPGPDGDTLVIESAYPLALARDIAAACAHVTVVSPDGLREHVTELVTRACDGR